MFYQMTQGMLAEFGMEPAKRGSKMISVAAAHLSHSGDLSQASGRLARGIVIRASRRIRDRFG